MPQKDKLPFSLDPLDPNFVPAKPRYQNQLKPSVLVRLEKEGKFASARKYDGYCTLAAITKRVRLYTRGIQDTTERYPWIAEELKKLQLPEDTLIVGEVVVLDENGKENFPLLTSIAKSSPADAIKLQEQFGRASFFIFDVLVYAGKVVADLPYQERLNIIYGWFVKAKPFYAFRHVLPVELPRYIFELAKKYALKKGWEGLVLHDNTSPTAFHLDGRTDDPPRPEGSWKWKPYSEGDFIAYKWVKGTGKNKNRLGKMFIAQINPQTRERVPCGEVGNGFTAEEREEFADDALYPMVVEVEFQKRFPSGSLRHPNFLRPRPDKKPEECKLPEGFIPKSTKKRPRN